jgi:tetratricopeptide (TPR) repeat protein
MNNRLPPAWSKHIKSGPLPKGRVPQAGPPGANPIKANPLSHADADDALLKQAYTLQQDKKLAEAQDLCLEVLARTPNHPLALYIMGTVCLGYDDEAALRYFARAVGEQPENAYYHLSLGEAYAKVSEFSPAIQHMQHALQLQPVLVPALCALGRAYIGFDKPELALPLFERALKINRDHPKVRSGLASALSGLGRMGEAAAYLKEAIGRRVDLPGAYNDLVQTRKFMEEPAELKSILRELGNPRLDSDGAQKLHHAAGKVLNDLKRYEEAFYHFNKAKQATGYEFDIDLYRRWVDTMIEMFTPEMLASRTGFGNPSILGGVRSQFMDGEHPRALTDRRMSRNASRVSQSVVLSVCGMRSPPS